MWIPSNVVMWWRTLGPHAPAPARRAAAHPAHNSACRQRFSLSAVPSPTPRIPSILAVCIPGRLFLDSSKLDYTETEGSVLGQGGSGTVIYRAQYQGSPVAVKRFQIKKCKSSAGSATGTPHPLFGGREPSSSSSSPSPQLVCKPRNLLLM